jgi:hypothetical protein
MTFTPAPPASDRPGGSADHSARTPSILLYQKSRRHARTRLAIDRIRVDREPDAPVRSAGAGGTHPGLVDQYLVLPPFATKYTIAQAAMNTRR